VLVCYYYNIAPPADLLADSLSDSGKSEISSDSESDIILGPNLKKDISQADNLFLQDIFHEDVIKALNPWQREDFDFLIKMFKLDDLPLIEKLSKMMFKSRGTGSVLKDGKIVLDNPSSDIDWYIKDLIKCYKDYKNLKKK